MKKLISAVLCAVMLISLAACGESPSGLPDPDAESVPPTATPSPTPVPTPTPLPYTNPLSGEPMDEDISMNRPWAAMINNIPQALPQRGTSQAEIIYEIPAEGGVTRMMALFTDISEVEALGSMRSIRPYYAETAFSYDAIIVHAGGSEAAYSLLRNTGWDHLDGVRETYASKPFERDPNRMSNGVEHSLFANGPKLIEAAEGKGFHFEHEGGVYDNGLKFSADPAGQCTENAENAVIYFNSYKTTSFEYNADDGLYYGSQWGGEWIDETADNAQQSFTNLIFLQTDIKIIDNYARLEVRLTGEGSGWYVTGGKYAEISWEREENGVFRYYLADGSELELVPGRTYIGIMGSDAGCTAKFEKPEA